MKRLLSFLLGASALFIFGCNTTPDPVLTVSPENLAFSAEGGVQTVQVKANNPWTASATGAGISINPSSGDGDATVTVTATATDSPFPITGTINFRSEGLSAVVSITQEERKVIQLGDVMTIPAEGGSFAIDVKYNTDVVVEVESEAQSWIRFVAVRALKSGKLEFGFAENGSTDPRQGKVTVKDKNGKVSPITLTFVQEEKKVIAVGDVMEIPVEGGTFAVDIQYNTEYTVEVEASAKSWISFLGTRALQSGKLEFQFAENQSTDPRQGKVTVKDKSGKVSDITLTFVQEEKKVITVGDVMTIPAEGGTFAVDIQYNTDFDVVVESGAQSWITFVATRALKSGKLEFGFAENQSTDPRQGKVTVKDKSGKVSDFTLTFVQEEKKIITVGDVMTIPAEGGTFAVDIQYNTDFDVVVESGAQSWITFVATRALTSGKLEFQFAENGSTDPRQGKVTVKDKNGKVSPITLTFVQAEKKVIAVGDVMEIPAEGGTFTVDIQYNTDFKVEIAADAINWIRFVATRALTSGKLEFRFTENPSTDPREGRVTVKDKNGKVEPVTLTFVQKENSPFIDFKDSEVKAICIQLWDSSGNGELSEREASAVTNLGYGRFEDMGIHSFDELRFFTGIKTIPVNCFRNCSQLESITLPLQLESIGECAFLNCSALKGDLVLPDNIKTIDEFAFNNCGFTGSLTLPESLEKLGYGAFDGCRGFTGDLTIPKGTKTIEGQCFLYCSDFKGELTIPETVSSIGYLAFGYTDFSKARIISRTPVACDSYAFYSSDYLIYVPSGTAKTYQEAPGWTEFRGRITEEGHDPSDFFYASTDYSRDGEVICLQQATKGKGIDFVFMGDGFVDKDMEPGGKYETLMRRWMDHFFTYEPYKSFREWFSIYVVKVVSKNDVFNCPSSERKLTRDDGNGVFGNTISTLISIANEYASTVTSGPKRITVFMNTKDNVGRSFCSFGSDGFNAWVFDCIDRRPSTLIHEAGGHGFGWLGDEYTEFNQAFTNPESLDRSHSWGFYPNLDWRSDPETVYWAHFLKDPRYSKEGLGVFEGGMRYTYGIYRPTMNSMMRHDYEKGAVFNAPGREAIYKRIMQWGIGDGWEYDYEAFVAADEAGRKQAADAYAEYPPTRSYVKGDDMEPGLPPILIDESVKEIRITKDGKVTLIR